MDQNLGRTDLLPGTVPTLALALMAAFGIILWLILHWALGRRRTSVSTKVRLGILSLTGGIATWCLLQCAARYCYLSGGWTLWAASFVTSITIEGTSILYERECAVVSRLMARALMFCRMTAIFILVFILLQPVLFGEKSRPVRRRVAVMFDQSSSMLRRDKQWTDAEKAEIAQATGVVSSDARPFSEFSVELAGIPQKFSIWSQMMSSDSKPENMKELSEITDAAVKTTDRISKELAALMDRIPKNESGGKLREVLITPSQNLNEILRPALAELRKALASHGDVASPLLTIGESIGGLLDAVPVMASVSDAVLWETLNDDGKQKTEASLELPRAELGRRVMLGLAGDGNKAPLDALRSKYDVDVFRFGQETSPLVDIEAFKTNAIMRIDADDETVDTNAVETAFRSGTDITKAMENVISSIPSEELAGVLLVTDGRHTGAAGVEAISRRMGQSRVPVSTIVIGGTRLPFDVSIANVRAPESVFLGDRVRIAPTVSVTGGKGKEITIHFMYGETQLGEEKLKIDSDEWAKEVRFTDTPEDRGLRRYRLVVDALAGEEIADNNSWELDVSVSDDRTNVLLIDSFPRWEYRYLKNLFYGRDKSVHLQYWLVNPDTLASVPKPDHPAASVARKFGDAECGSLPSDKNEWRKFDVIILGDIDERVLTPTVVENVRYCVEERGALLVVIAGPENMPYRIKSSSFRDMLPVLCKIENNNHRTSPEKGFRLQLTPAGRSHPVMQQSTSAFENESTWADIPDLHWRFPVEGVKPGAEVLAYAATLDTRGTEGTQKFVAELTEDPESAAEKLKKIRDEQAKNALIVTRNLGRGRVLMLNTDRTWRFRYRVGDLRHHHFWGQVVRWGTGEKLRAGNTFVRLGSDKLRYTPTDEIKVLARMSDSQFVPLEGLHAKAILSLDDKELGRVDLEYRKDSNGMYEGTLPPIQTPGVYTLELDSPEARARLKDDFPETVKTRFVVVTALRPAEYINVTADWNTPKLMARLSGGTVIPISDVEAVTDLFGEGSRVIIDKVEFQLWNSWIFFIVIIALLSVEWLLRKKGGLA